MKKYIGAIAIGALTVGCTPLVPVENLNRVPPATIAAAMNIRIFTVESGAAYPPIEAVISEVSAYSCKFMMWDPPASKGDALKRLRLEALKVGANAVIDVTFDERGTDAYGTNCWESVHASGQAVKIRQP